MLGSSSEELLKFLENLYSARTYADMLPTEPISPHAVSTESSPTYSVVEYVGENYSFPSWRKPLFQQLPYGIQVCVFKPCHH
ncbi:unnamed protein product [Acanthoscelides obtectus]|uniref:Uncharacterized protein n=1 Tax=Acanthoscelides obtectus TaxID=200917 RepID=A0A9P0LHW3_ACAOB|nr:unnamed protein product [Acanthoscelides obtectus]CAK1654442.1 hypothetical protein AOBTE_LOCUS18598 [Acanthoscelides obtectus]